MISRGIVALKKGKTEHSGDRSQGSKEGFRGLRAAAKRTSRKLRRLQDKQETKVKNASN